MKFLTFNRMRFNLIGNFMDYTEIFCCFCGKANHIVLIEPLSYDIFGNEAALPLRNYKKHDFSDMLCELHDLKQENNSLKKEIDYLKMSLISLSFDLKKKKENNEG